MTEDDIDPIEEIHRIRREMYAEAGGTPAAFVRYLRALEKKRAHKTVPHATPRSRKPTVKASRRRIKILAQ
jgi:hypothetical protein